MYKINREQLMSKYAENIPKYEKLYGKLFNVYGFDFKDGRNVTITEFAKSFMIDTFNPELSKDSQKQNICFSREAFFGIQVAYAAFAFEPTSDEDAFIDNLTDEGREVILTM